MYLQDVVSGGTGLIDALSHMVGLIMLRQPSLLSSHSGLLFNTSSKAQ
jgi:hypothetical protein